MADLDKRLSLMVPKEYVSWVLKTSEDLGLTPNALNAQFIEAMKEMMDEAEPSLPGIVQQYRALKSVGALRSQLAQKKKPLGSSAAAVPKKKS